MSHTDNCPDRWTARRAGERAFERGGSRYSSDFDCNEADYNFRRGYDAAAERHQEEEREDSARADRRRAAEEQQQSEEYWAMVQEQESLAQQEQYDAHLAQQQETGIEVEKSEPPKEKL